jgi:hypothetical protein
MTFIGDYNFSGNEGELRFQNASAEMTWVEGDLNGDKISDFRIFVAGEHEMTASDFIL